MTKAAQYALALAEWERTASEDDKIDGMGEPEGPTLERDGEMTAWVEDDGGLYVESRSHSAAEALALRDFISANYEEPRPSYLGADHIEAEIQDAVAGVFDDLPDDLADSVEVKVREVTT